MPSAPERTNRVGFGVGLAVGLGEALGVAAGLWGRTKAQRLTHGFEGSLLVSLIDHKGSLIVAGQGHA
jgi:hypothetical protein